MDADAPQPVVTAELRAAVAELIEWYDARDNGYTYPVLHAVIRRLQQLPLPAGEIGHDITLFLTAPSTATRIQYNDAIERLRYLTRPGLSVVPNDVEPRPDAP